jgi:heme-degrading monooxygenase HmoA
MLASVTRLRVRSVRFFPSFLWRTFQSRRQVERAPGFLGGRLLIDSGLTFWTLTAWLSEETMRNFAALELTPA